MIEYRKNLVEIMSNKVSALDRKNFAVQQHLKYVDFMQIQIIIRD